MLKTSLININSLKILPSSKIEILVQKIGQEKYAKDEFIINQGDKGTKFYIIKSGKVDVFINNSYIRTLGSNQHFGERALFFNEKRSASIKAIEEVELFCLDSNDFSEIMEENLKEYLLNRLHLQDNRVELEDLVYIHEIGQGSYGTVCLVQSVKTKFCYAIKSLPKSIISSSDLKDNIQLEKDILLRVDHPFISKLVKTLKDDDNIYFLMEYIKGKDLFDSIREIGILNKYQTQFYGASMMLVIEYLHKNRFIYRDIKPENIIVQSSVTY